MGPSHPGFLPQPHLLQCSRHVLHGVLSAGLTSERGASQPVLGGGTQGASQTPAGLPSLWFAPHPSLLHGLSCPERRALPGAGLGPASPPCGARPPPPVSTRRGRLARGVRSQGTCDRPSPRSRPLCVSRAPDPSHCSAERTHHGEIIRTHRLACVTSAPPCPQPIRLYRSVSSVSAAGSVSFPCVSMLPPRLPCLCLCLFFHV